MNQVILGVIFTVDPILDNCQYLNMEKLKTFIIAAYLKAQYYILVYLNAIEKALDPAHGLPRTPDIGGKATTTDLGKSIAEILNKA